MIGNCKNCKHWGGPVDKADNETERRSCQAFGTLTVKDLEGGPISIAVCTGLSINTTADFGCALFEPQPEPELSPQAEDARKWCG